MAFNEREPTVGPKAPDARELAAIITAVDACWLRSGVEEEMSNTAESMWKFTNRWWNKSSVWGRGRPRRPGSFS